MSKLNKPKSEPHMVREILVPCVLLAGDVFPLTQTVYRKDCLSPCNCELSRACRIAENDFGQMAVVFRMFRNPVSLKPHKVMHIVLTCIHLYDYLRRKYESRVVYCPSVTYIVECPDIGEVIEGT